jgi:predicted nucleic acid-binding protein
MNLAVLDTDIVSEILKGRNLIVSDWATQYLGQHEEFAFSTMTKYEVHRRELITGNMSHFSWIPDLTVRNWKEE